MLTLLVNYVVWLLCYLFLPMVDAFLLHIENELIQR